MNLAFFGLALVAAVNPKLLGADLLLAENRRPQLMFLCFLLGGLGLSVSIGLIDVVFLQATGVKTERSLSGGIDLLLGSVLVLVGVLVATGRLGRRRARPAEPGARDEAKGWGERILGEPRPGLAILVGALAGTPGATYIVALKQLVTSDSSIPMQAVGVVAFNLIMFAPMIIPLVLLDTWPEATKARLHGISNWIARHTRGLIAGVTLSVGVYMIVTGIARVAG
jgi:hypothetical protein